MTIHSLYLCVFVLILLLAVLANAQDVPSIKVDPKTRKYVDSYGRIRIFHGVNVVYKDPPFYPPITDRFDANSSLAQIDIDNLSKWGFNMVRLYSSWEATAIAPGRFNTTYIRKLKELTTALGRSGIYTLLDAHQDAFNPKFCGEGVPDWAVKYSTHFPSPLPMSIPIDPATGYPKRSECLKHPFFEYYLTRASNQAFQSLYDNVDGIQDQFALFWRTIAENFHNVSSLLGYEVINEPWPGDVYKDPLLLIQSGRADRLHLGPMYKRIHDAIRQVDDNHILFYEPSVTDIGKMGFETGPGGPEYNDRQVLSYHIYCNIVDRRGDPKSKWLCNEEDNYFWWLRTRQLEELGGGSFLSEFGAVSNGSKGIQQLDYMTGKADEHLESWAYWQFKYYNDFTTVCMPGTTESFYDVDGSLQFEKVKALSRTYAYAICGVPSQMKFDPKTAEFKLTYTTQNCGGMPTEIFLNEEWYYPRGFSVVISPPSAATFKLVRTNYLHVFANDKDASGMEITISVSAN